MPGFVGVVTPDEDRPTCIDGGGIGILGNSCAGGIAISGTGGGLIPHGGGIGGCMGGIVMYGLKGPGTGPPGSLLAAAGCRGGG